MPVAPVVPLPRDAFFIQPHYDDVALSCGGVAAGWAAAGVQAHIVTAFASEVLDAMVGEFAAAKHSRWHLDDADAVHAQRREEDARAAQALGCTLRWLGLPDAIYRGERYTSDASLYDAPHPEELALASHLADELLQLPEWKAGRQVFVPLGIGQHVDHQLVFETGAVLASRGVEVWAYEDLPYAIHTPSAIARRTGQLGGRVEGAVAVPVGCWMDRKLDAVAAYASQVPVIFRFTDDYRAALTAHAAAVGGDGGLAERFWRVAG